MVLCPDPPPPSSKYGVTTSPRFPGQINTVPELNQLSSQRQFPDSDEICKECHHSCKNKLNMLGLTSLNPLLPAIIDTSGILSRTMSIMFFVNLVGTMSFIVWRLMMMASMIPSTSSQLTLSNVSLATTGYFTCTVTGRDIPIKEDYDAKQVTIAVPPDDPPTITEVPAHFSPEDCSTFNPPAVAAVDNAAPLLHPHHIPGVPGPLQLAPLQHQLHGWGRSANTRLVISNLTTKN